ncbi:MULTISPECIES: HlyD family secretion protein [Shewanella]|uniref:HlyD family efflux transporter periplasmic adaptor subunit n=1 Tax=Shewanella chilikensis TaxID=558541 RepID=A0A6G7LW13_9GAMM|nr:MULTISPECIES: HlyD family efflux transporter periplasmic adaptor subunit [Shewanella]MCE9789634.1 HlyD family secretion protein [Shewanella chilikensis]MCL1155231.1 HlyD family secretion protein [Shewanella chilikensis]NDO76563.1 HlyD family efflux transporter periplasmic adaptor subunit [Shewanella sp. SE1]PYE53997.1 membrane fusion protein [Shewanella chilikensis]QIJ06003.1 HlyD family efflux transporter periplasmic adaptor subunit [Shewanella chilikensis]
MSSLFRKQAVEAQKQKLHGDISLAQPLSIYNSAFIIFVVVTAIAVFLSCSHYARKETVRGYLVPNKGLIKTFANRSGNVEKLHVSEGALVQEGDPLVTIVFRRSMTSGEELSESLIGELKQQLDLLEAERVVNQRMLADESVRLRTAISDNQSSLSVITNLEKLLSEKLSMQLSQQNQHKKLYQDGFLSELDYQSQQEKLINIRQEIENVKSNKVTVSSQLNASQAELKLLPYQYALKESEIKRRRSDLQRQVDETENNYRYVIRAAEAGTVAAIQIVDGEFIATNRPLMSLIPQGAELVAELLLPTRSAGFIREGDEARLRFDAFPYQRFGFLESHISRIDKALLLDGEARVPVNLSEPVYRIRTQLSKQDMLAYGEAFPLKSGMLLEADIVLDRRSLLDWLLDPIYSLKGRVG